MKTHPRISSILAIFVLLLAGAWASAQTAKAADKKAGDPPAPASEKKAKTTGNMQNVQVNPYFQDNQNQGDMPTHARRDSAASQKTKSTASMSDAQSNPMYKDNKHEGTNPLYERDSAARTNAPSNGATASHEVVEYKDPEDMTARSRSDANKASEYQEGGKNDGKAEYKDPEDMTTRYRPGNNKTAKVKPTGATAGAGASEYKDGEDGTMHTRPGKPR